MISRTHSYLCETRYVSCVSCSVHKVLKVAQTGSVIQDGHEGDILHRVRGGGQDGLLLLLPW